MNGVLMWGFWESAHWKPDAAPWRKDWSPKPHADAWIDLVTKRWWTRANATTAADGTARVRGYLGDYEITASLGGRTKTVTVALTKDGTAVRIQLP